MTLGLRDQRRIAWAAKQVRMAGFKPNDPNYNVALSVALRGIPARSLREVMTTNPAIAVRAKPPTGMVAAVTRAARILLRIDCRRCRMPFAKMPRCLICGRGTQKD